MKDTYEIARRRVEKKKGFYRHFRGFLIVSILLVFLNLIPFFTEWQHHPGAPLSEVLEELFFYYPYWYVQYPIFGWSIGILLHFAFVFVLGRSFDEWEERALEREIKQLQKQNRFELPDEKMELREIETSRIKNRKWDDSELV